MSNRLSVTRYSHFLACCSVEILLLAGMAGTAFAADGVDEIFVSSTRLQTDADDRGMIVTHLGAVELEAAPTARLDEILAQIPGVSLFRRSTSRTSHPTTQGVTLRGIGPNGAGRTLVLLDGVPQNDPFGGWVYWSALSIRALEGVNVIEGSSAGRWGNQALAGLIDIRSDDNPARLKGALRFGTDDTWDGWAQASAKVGSARITVHGGGYDSKGPYLTDADQRGPLDIRAASSAWQAGVKTVAPIGESTSLRLSFDGFGEDRVNGMRLATNSLKAWDASAALAGRLDSSSWQVTGYYQDRKSKNSFSSVVAGAPPIERQVLNQFDVPATGYGASMFYHWETGAGDIELGGDIRAAKGETNEDFRNVGQGYTRWRKAGGQTLLVGAYLDYLWKREDLAFSATARADRWQVSHGQIREYVIGTDELVRDDAVADRNGVLPSGRMGISYNVAGAVRLKSSAYTGFRLPTLNEFFRPFRVGNDITEANPALKTERLYGFDAGVEYQPLAAFQANITYFRNWLQDGVGNITIGVGPGNFPPTGFVPAGGTLRQRQNIGLVLIDGIEAGAVFKSSRGWQVDARYMYVNARVAEASNFPALEGLQVAQSPKHQLSLSTRWTPVEQVGLNAALRYNSAQFDDDLNTRRLNGFATLDLSADYDVREGVAVFVEAQNLLKTRIESAISGDGLVSLGQQRVVSVGVRFKN